MKSCGRYIALGMYYNCFRCINACPTWEGPGSGSVK